MTTPPGFTPPGDDGHTTGGTGGNTDAAVVGLARDAEQIRGQVQALEAQVTELANTVVRLAETRHPSNAHAHGDGGGGAGDGGDGGGLVSWLDLPHGPGHAETVLVDLVDLVDWLARVYLRYPDAAGLPECWMWHPHVVEELVWLRHVWATAYQPDGGSPSLAGDWHDRYRPGVARRIQASVGTCSLAAHQPRDGRPRPSAPPRAPLAAAVGDIAAWWGHHRHQPAPEPTSDQLAAAEDYVHARDHTAREAHR